MERVRVVFYSKVDCPLCDKGLAVLHEIDKEIPLDIEVIDIYQDDELLEKYQIMIPVVEINGEEVDYGILTREKIEKYLR
ncbi:glutaredoxin family protein [Anaerobacillus sp. MEB173]|uniref:glutaredoxin family protein n=1 Tax=Anaerobacillus sp. MEB173 TaxID=3383345 RepID=UPI003F8DD0AF